MTSNFDNEGFSKANNHSASEYSRNPAASDSLKRDRYELLSAYLDGEVTSAEKRQVEEWLANDYGVRCLYSRLLKLRRGLQTMPVPVASQTSVDQTIDAVYKKVNRRPQVLLAVLGTAITVFATSLILPNNPVRVQFSNFMNQAPKESPESKPSSDPNAVENLEQDASTNGRHDTTIQQTP